MEGLGYLAYCLGLLERSARIFGAAECLWLARSTNFSQPDYSHFTYTRRKDIRGALRAEMGEAAYNPAYAEGMALTLEQAVAYALAE